MKYFPLLCAVSILIVFICTPIVAYDNDLWFHLLGGHYFLETYTIPDHPFFSFFMSKERWLSYFWLFQVIVSVIYKVEDYQGLVILRAMLFFVTLITIMRIFHEQKREKADYLGVGLVTLVFLSLIQRELVLRPHIFSYLFLVLSLLVLEKRWAVLPLLPVISMLWINIHGIEYPIFVLIIGAYLAEYCYQRYVKRQKDAFTARERWGLILGLYALLVNPFGFSLLKLPFNPVLFHEKVIQELLINRQAIFSLYFGGMEILLTTSANLLVFITILFFGYACVYKQVRVVHAVLFPFSLYLLWQYNRFQYEFILLNLVLLKDISADIATRLAAYFNKSRYTVIKTVYVGFLFVFFSFAVYGQFWNRPAYPLSYNRLPVGIVSFLKQHGGGGKILNVANTGGYLEWELFPDYSIFMDMQTSLFPETDFFVALNVFQNPLIFKNIVDKHEPDFISAPIEAADFVKIVESRPQYKMVFFDDREVLYANEVTKKEVAERFRMSRINPYQLAGFKYDLPVENRSELTAEALRLDAVCDKVGNINNLLSQIAIDEKRFDDAMGYAEKITTYYPDSFLGYALKGIIDYNKGSYQQSLDWTKKALARVADPQRPKIQKNLFLALIKLEKYDDAYKTISTFVNPLDSKTSYEDILDLGISAMAIGKNHEAELLLTMARLKTPEDKTDILRKISEMQGLLKQPDENI